MMNANQVKIWKAASKNTLPVLMGYVAMGMAAGILFTSRVPVKWTPFWGFLTSGSSISGALQFLMSNWGRMHTSLLEVAFLTLCLNLRYAMYGLSLLDRYRGLGFWKKSYLIWAMTDETYALCVENKHPEGTNSVQYCLAVSVLDHSYWIVGVVLGCVLGNSLPFRTAGIDFAMTALFLVVLVDQLRDVHNRMPAMIGAGAALLSRLFFATGKMLIPAIILIFVTLIVFRSRLERRKS